MSTLRCSALVTGNEFVEMLTIAILVNFLYNSLFVMSSEFSLLVSVLSSFFYISAEVNASAFVLLSLSKASTALSARFVY